MVIIEKASGTLWKYHTDKLHATIVNSESLKFRIKITQKNLPMVIQRILKYQYH